MNMLKDKNRLLLDTPEGSLYNFENTSEACIRLQEGSIHGFVC